MYSLEIIYFCVFLFFRIKKIEHLDSLTKLDVLDLHGNEVNFDCDVYPLLYINLSRNGN